MDWSGPSRQDIFRRTSNQATLSGAARKATLQEVGVDAEQKGHRKAQESGIS